MDDNNKIITVEDKNLTYVRLTEQGSYLVDDELITIKGWNENKEVYVKNIDDIRMINTYDLISHYQRGEQVLSLDDYDILKKKLLKNAKYDNEDGSIYFENLEVEYEWKKFKRDWKEIKKTTQVISDPIQVEKISIRYDSGNEFITNRFFNGMKKDISLYEYNREGAIWTIINDTFESIGFKYQNGLEYRGTEGKKLWSGNNPEYVVAFGTFLWGNRNKLYLQNSVGTLNDMLEKYEQDKRRIKNDIMVKYNSYYRDNSNFDFDSLLSSLNRAKLNLNGLKINKSGKNIEEYNTTMQSINYSIKIINEFLIQEG
jgi:hypothetical protein